MMSSLLVLDYSSDALLGDFEFQSFAFGGWRPGCEYDLDPAFPLGNMSFFLLVPLILSIDSNDQWSSVRKYRLLDQRNATCQLIRPDKAQGGSL